ncbi:MAG: flagellar biosynthesis anti-sigma factor FlgM, partial [Polyangiales bacterium]
MRVQGPGKPSVAQVQDRSQVKGAGAQKVEPSSGERVEVSSLSRMLADVRLPDSPDVAKVEKLRDSIRVGAFKVNQEQVAHTMVQEET